MNLDAHGIPAMQKEAAARMVEILAPAKPVADTVADKPPRAAVPYGPQAFPMRALEFALRGSAIRLRATEFAFQPSSIAALPGVPLTLEIINSGILEHTIVIPAFGVQATLLPGEHRN